MTNLLDHALDSVRALPSAAQDDIARLVLRLTEDEDGTVPTALTADERATIALSKAAAARGEYATDAQVRAVWEKYAL